MAPLSSNPLVEFQRRGRSEFRNVQVRTGAARSGFCPNEGVDMVVTMVPPSGDNLLRSNPRRPRPFRLILDGTGLHRPAGLVVRPPVQDG